MIGRLKLFAWNRQGEFRIFWLYISAVFLHGVCANWHPPILEVIWDMVFYKNLAYGLHHISSFDLQRHFPVPPLYPLLISPVFFASDYQMVERLLSWINPAMYFLGLYPAYGYARSILNPRQSAWVCVLYALYPSAIYSQWTMSENLAAPLGDGAGCPADYRRTASHAGRNLVGNRPGRCGFNSSLAHCYMRRCHSLDRIPDVSEKPVSRANFDGVRAIGSHTRYGLVAIRVFHE